jgi:hypothetical protein
MAAPLLESRVPALKGVQEALKINIPSRIILILLSLLIGVFKILSVTAGDVAVVGDLFPALGLLVIAMVFFLDYYTEQAEIRSGFIERLQKVFITNKKFLGVVLIAVGLLHFLFPGVLFL